MARITTTGLNETIREFEKLEINSEKVLKKVLYEGASVAADTVKSTINALTVDNEVYTRGVRKGPSSIQKAGLVHSFGISPMRTRGGAIDVKLGFDGYNRVRSKKWPQGQPNAMIARSVESGTSFMEKQPFIRKAEQQAKLKVISTMQKTLDKEIEKLTK